jgi:signal transduction histidine kinase
MGLGLYIAQTVALAHGSAVRVASSPLGFEIASIPQACNTFSFAVKNVIRRSMARR